MTPAAGSLPRRLLLTLVVVSGLATLASTTLGSLSATVVNGSNTFQSGTIVVKDTVGSTVCLSTGSGVDTSGGSSTCAGDVLGAATGQKPGGTAVTQTVVLKNDGTINAGSALLWSAACNSVNASAETYHGGGNVCTVTDLTIYDQTHTACVYPTTGGSCTVTTGKTVSDWVSRHGSQGTAATLTALNAGASTTYVFTTQLESTAPGTMQGMAVSADFDWYLSQ